MRERIRVQDIGLDHDEIERRKQLTRDLWEGLPVDHIPVYITVENPQPKYTIREQFQDADKQLEEALTVVDLTWKHLPQGDLVPAMRPDVGCSPLATAFGAELFWGDDPNQTCGVKVPPLAGVEQAMELMAPDVILVPHVVVRPDKRPGELYRRMREIAVEYAKRMDWGWLQ